MAKAEEAEALFQVLASLVHSLVENGAVSIAQLETMEKAFRLQAEATYIDQKRANCELAADYAAILRGVSTPDKGVKHAHPHLRVVQDDGESGDAPAPPRDE